MAKTVQSISDRSSLPTREDILAFLAREKEAMAKSGNAGKIGKREIARAFGVKGDARIELKRLLAELAADGAIERRGKGVAKRGALPPVVLADIVGRDENGELVATPAEWDEELGPPPRIAIHAPRKAKTGAPLPSVGDRALIRAEPDRDAGPHDPPYAGRVIKLLSRSKHRALGVLRLSANGAARIESVEKKQAGREFVIAREDVGEARDGDLVSVDLIGKTRLGAPRAKIRESLGSVTGEKAVSLIALRAHDIPDEFNEQALAEAERASRAAPLRDAPHEDWRALPLVTIDPPDAKDHDDAVHATPDEAPDNAGGFVVTVAIADVAWYVRPFSALDKEALTRGNSVYFPDRVVPMLPERISNDLCSLRPDEDRPALAVRIRIAKDGRKIGHSFHRVLMRSRAKLAYAQAQAAIDGHPDDAASPLLANVLRPLWSAYDAARLARNHRSPLELDLPERKILLKPDGAFDRVILPPRLDAHRLIEEFMILANVCAAETLEENRQQLIYRAHDEPSQEKLSALSEFLQTIGVKFAKGQVVRPSHFNAILARVKGMEHENIVNEIILRTQAQAEYSHDNYGHFGLNLRRYAHFTSPIRRYADLIVHRALIRALRLGEGALPDTAAGELAEIAASISAAERRAMAAERETVDRLIAAHLADQIGTCFPARVSGVTRSGLFVRLLDTGADGFVPAATLGRDYFAYDERAHSLSSRSGESYRLADMVEVRLMEAAPIAGALRFEIVNDAAKKFVNSQRRPVKTNAFAKKRRGK